VFYTYSGGSLSCAGGMIIRFLNKAIEIRVINCNVKVVAVWARVQRFGVRRYV
jgi:hypothetical protein